MNGKRRLIGEIAVLLFFIIIVALVFHQISTSLADQGVASGDALFNAALFPRGVAVLITVLVAFVLFDLRHHTQFEPETAAKTDDQSRNSGAPNLKTTRTLQLAILAVLIAYLLTIEWLGFHLTTFISTSAVAIILNARPLIMAVTFGLAFTAGISFLFEGVLKVVLPVGIFEFTPPYHLIGF